MIPHRPSHLRCFPASAGARRRILLILCAAVGLAANRLPAEIADAYRGLWVGEVKLNYATEVTVPLDENNIAIAPDPATPTPTFDEANLRLILHVSGAGHVSLLKDVAILDRFGDTNVFREDSDLALVTEETLYGEFPPQAAVRIASATFDFGDSKATDAVNAMLDVVLNAVTNVVATNNANLNTDAGRVSAEIAAAEAGVLAAAPVMDSADVATAFFDFLQTTNFDSVAVDAIAAASNPTNAAQDALTAATNLWLQSFYGDTRGVEMVNAVLEALAHAGTNFTERSSVAQNAAAAFADLEDDYHRFIAGKSFGDMISVAAQAAALAATNPAATSVTISNAVDQNEVVNAVREEAIQIKVTAYEDIRGSNAVEQVLFAIVTNAVSSLALTNRTAAGVRASADKAGRETLTTVVRRYQVPFQPPTPDYLAFVASSNFLGSDDIAAQAAAHAAVLEKKNNALYTTDSLRREAKQAALVALRDVLSEAARAVRSELPLDGALGPGIGDPRLTYLIRQTNAVEQLGPPALTGSVFLPANHPTNPFRHRRHPDHTTGFDITRILRLDFDAGDGDVLARAGYGVDRITGVYREEVSGLHKPLGPQKNQGLKVEGTFELNRISLIDTLNAR